MVNKPHTAPMKQLWDNTLCTIKAVTS